jgi:hypothetical protein
VLLIGRQISSPGFKSDSYITSLWLKTIYKIYKKKRKYKNYANKNHYQHLTELNVGGGEYLEVGRVEEDPDGTDVRPATVHPLPEQEQSIF